MDIPLARSARSVSPQLSVFVDLAQHASFDYLPSQVLPQFLREPESVAASVLVGEGTSYTVTKRKVNSPERVLPAPVKQGGITVSVGGQAPRDPHIPSVVVYKTARVQFNDVGESQPGFEEACASVLLDFLVLSHPPVIRHKNLANLLGLAWAWTPSGIDKVTRIPVPIVQYAEHGNLAHYQSQHLLEFDRKGVLLLDVATGLEFLHRCDIVHGDVKSENVLLFIQSGRLLAKLSDFGSSLPGGQGVFDFIKQGTALWAAPEILDDSVQRQYRHQCDVFSYGLTALRIALDGEDPLSRYMLSFGVHSTAQADENSEVERPTDSEVFQLYMEDVLPDRADVPWLVGKYTYLRLRRIRPRNTAGRMAWTPEEVRSQLGIELGSHQSIFPVNKFMTCLREVLRNTLRRLPEQRNLATALRQLMQLNGRDPNIRGPDSVSITSTRRYRVLRNNGSITSYLAMRELQPDVMHSLFSYNILRAQRSRDRQQTLQDIELANCTCYMSGMGSDREFDLEKSLFACLRAANGGNTGAKGVLYRIAKAQGAAANMVPALEWCASRGSVAAMEDLREASPGSVERALRNLRDHTCGVGADFFHAVIGPFTYIQLSHLDVIKAYLNDADEPASQIVVNKRGDTLIHAAASGGNLEVLCTLIDDYNVPIDLCNQVGETPLLCGMRSGHLALVKELLLREATAAIISSRNETVFHWLISMPDEAVDDLITGLTECGGDPATDENAERCDYSASMIGGYQDRWDKLPAGTPLHWAVCRKRSALVRGLMQRGANPLYQSGHTIYTTAYALAAYCQDHVILKTMIELRFPRPRWHCFDAGNYRNLHTVSREIPGGSLLQGMSELIKEAVRGSDRYLMVVRWGASYKEQLEKTFELLGEELSFQGLVEGVDGKGSSPLQFAARGGYHEAAQFIYHYMDGPRWINHPYADGGGITPIFDAIRRDNKTLFNFLLEKGARVDIKIDSPGMHNHFDWCILHIVAQNMKYKDLEIAKKVIDLGIPPDGYETSTSGDTVGEDARKPPQTPLAISIAADSFVLAEYLRSKGADINATSCFILSGRVQLSHATTILGQIIAANLRDCLPRLKYLLWPGQVQGRSDSLPGPSFLVTPTLGYTALHAAVMAHRLRIDADREELDPRTRRAILIQVLDRFDDDPAALNATTSDEVPSSALHLAVCEGYVEAVELLLDRDGVDVHCERGDGRTAIELASARLAELERDGHDDSSTMLEDARKVLRMLNEQKELDEDDG